MDEQIFAIQAYGGISRVFAELALEFSGNPAHGVDLASIDAPIVNRYVLDDPALAGALHVRAARSPWTALARYFATPRIHPNCDILHNTFYLPHGLASTRGAKRIVTVHDMIPERLPRTRRRLDLLTLKRHYVQRADHIICISEATKADMIDCYGSLDCPVSVVHHGVDPRFRPGVARLPMLPSRYVLMVGHRGQYKDGQVLMRAFAEVAGSFPDLSLACIGGGELTRQERQVHAELGIEGRVMVAQLPDDLMPAAYANAAVFVFPSRFEGFGLPALEAMASGVPCILADATSLPEVGGDAVAYFPAGDEQGLAQELHRLLADPEAAARLAHAGLRRSATFTWQACAERTAQAYRTALSN